MTVVAASANLFDIQEINNLIPSINEGDNDMIYVDEDEQIQNNPNKLVDNSKMKRRFFNGLLTVSFIEVIINTLAMDFVGRLAFKQLHQWKKSFENESNSAIEIQYHHMQKYAATYCWTFMITMCFIPISVIRIRGLIKIWQKTHGIIIILCFDAILYVALIFDISASIITKPNKFQQNISRNKYTLSTMPNSLLHFKFLCIISCVQHIILLVIILLTKPKGFDIFLDDNQCSPSLLELITNEEQKVIQEEEIDEICQNYVIC